MNKVIAALDVFNPSESTINYATYLAKEFNAHIVAVFLEDIIYHPYPYVNYNSEEELDYSTKVENVVATEEEIKTLSIKKLQKRFDTEGLRYNIHRDKFIAMESLIKESHFADMILIDVNERFSQWDDSIPSEFIKKLMAEADCPVMLVANEFKPIEKIIFAYDGSASSAYAIRQFSYLFPVAEEQELEILMITQNKHSNHFPEQKLLKELLKTKYKVVLQRIIQNNNSTDAMIAHLKAETKNSMVILGAYQRSALSRWLHESTADALISSSVNIPLFIAHK
jgi:hypothetical protein